MLPSHRTPLVAAVVGSLLAGALAALLVARSFGWLHSVPPPAGSALTVVRPTANVLTRIRDLKRLESVAFHLERVIDLSEKQSRWFGLIEAEDALLLVAAADVRAGVDLGKLGPTDVDADLERRSVRVSLPPAEVFGSALDNAKTYVHTRRTGVLARRQENLETRARQEAERALVEAALEAGIIARAEDNAVKLVSELVRSLGYERLDVSVRR